MDIRTVTSTTSGWLLPSLEVVSFKVSQAGS